MKKVKIYFQLENHDMFFKIFSFILELSLIEKIHFTFTPLMKPQEEKNKKSLDS